MRKSVAVALILFCIASIVNAQPSIEWAKCFGGVHPDYLAKIVEIPSGYVLAGTSFCTDLPGHHGYTETSDAWLVKISADGSNPKYLSIGGWSNEWVYDCVQTTDGGFALLGTTESHDADMKDRKDSSSQQLVFVAKVSPDFTLSWVKTYDTSILEFGYSIVQLSSGDFIVSGRRHVVGNTSQPGRIISLDTDGNKKWSKDIEIMDIKICKTINDKIMLTGTAMGFIATHGLSDIWVAQMTAEGKIQWQNTYGGSNSETASSITAYRDGEYDKFLIGGLTNSHDGQVTERHFADTNGWGNAWVLCVGGTGDLIWQTVLGGSEYENVRAIDATPDNGCIVGILTSSNDGDVTGERTIFDEFFYVPWVVKLGSKGEFQWGHSYDIVKRGNASSNCDALLHTKDNGYIFSAPVYSNGGDVAGFHGGSNIYSDAWVVKLSASPSSVISSMAQGDEALRIISHSDSYTISYSEAQTGPVELQLFDIMGHCIYSRNLGIQPPGDYYNDFSTEGITAGSYQVVLTSTQRVETAKLIIMH